MEKLTISEKIIATVIFAITAVGVIGIIWTYTELILDKYYLSKEYKYAIMRRIVTGGGDTKGHTGKVYNFVVNSKKYYGIAGGSYSTRKIYFVKFYPPDPYRNEAVYVEATEADIQNLPPDGYKTLPHH